MQFLGNTLAKIAEEKAGIIKENTPVVIGETTPETKPVFIRQAQKVNAPILFAEEEQLLQSSSTNESGERIYQTADFANLKGELGGLCQLKNTNTLLSAIRQLQKAGYRITEDNVREGFAHVSKLTGLMGRWQKLEEHPTLICDTGHNVGGIAYIVEQLRHQKYNRLHIVMGMVNDKDISGVLGMLPQNAIYYFTRASVKRALPENELKELAQQAGLQGQTYPNVKTALEAAKQQSAENDFIFVGGSSFIVADLLKFHV